MMNRRFTSAAVAAAASLALLAGTGSAVAAEADANVNATTNSSGSSVKADAEVEGGNKSGSSVDDITAKIKDALGSSKDEDGTSGSSVKGGLDKAKGAFGSSATAGEPADGDAEQPAHEGSSVDDITAKIKKTFGSSEGNTGSSVKGDNNSSKDMKSSDSKNSSDANAQGGFKLVLGLGALAMVFSFAYNWAVQNHLIAPLFR
ncbi:hypothetical protein [Corynebacterium pygosceleis]|uniref:Secreted protein n=1 Tax=Corynebacterium pygosceleis TaxID=2800406 RepID=A0A9Q4GLS6_9CORY|nr:hypothetical protein [Corynebacterium pygosceleis]MCK7637934.1 hypothetical protein [Corynebacterium pygosceleis]MCK7675649.1 hypothetical protein [Corynebacterium pygosceleis]MCL0120957.1 hypothetical protein [Corynebacterium pygosceleis]MCX7468650.1 hypothetical protein [Corynebacterium pygosceleis]